jgi:hypothetical protein
MQLIPDADLETAVGDAKVVYYVVFSKAIDEYVAAGEETHPSLAWLRTLFQETDVMTFNDLLVIKYER